MGLNASRAIEIAQQKATATNTRAPLADVKATGEVINARVVRAGTSLIVPNTISYKQAITLLERQIEHEEKITAVERKMNVFPWEGALAIKKAMEERFGVFTTQNTRTMFGERPPAERTIATGYNTTTTVPWGQFQWPLAEKNPFDPGHVKEYLEMGFAEHKGRTVFCLKGQIKMKWMDEVNKLLKRAEEFALNEPLYKGKAIRIAFTNTEGDLIDLPDPEFMDLTKFTVEDIVYSRDLEQLINTYIMTPLRYTEACRAARIPLKRGVLAAGPYGTGKSLLAQAVGKVGVENGWTFLYIRNASELPEAIRFAEVYQPCVVFAEDIDRATEGEERTDEIDRILNTLDGIDTKASEIMVILTTNHLDTVNPAMRRPGRLDVVLNITAPDGEAAGRLVKLYGRNLIAENSDLRRVGEMLDGQTPAVIREVVERAKLATIMRTGNPTAPVLPEDLEISARAMIEQQKLLHPIKVVDEDVAAPLIRRIAETVIDSMGSEVQASTTDALAQAGLAEGRNKRR